MTINYFNVDNRQQALLHLESLGYKDGDPVYLRTFAGKGCKAYPKKIAATYPNLHWDELEQHQHENKGIYFVVNGGGDNDNDVKHGVAIFCEWDNKDLDWQIGAWKEFNLLEPSLQIQTRKSIHNYWIFDEPTTVDNWKELQSDLLELTQSDQSLKNPSRVMRLAGYYHIQSQAEPIVCQIISNSSKRYSYNDLRQTIPHIEKEESIKEETANFTPIEHLTLYQDDDSEWDIRNFAELLDGYDPDGRKEWITAKCPNHDGESLDSLHINKDQGSFICHSGCPSKDVYYAALNLAISRGYTMSVYQDTNKTSSKKQKVIKDLSFQEICDQIDKIKQIECPGEQKHELRKLARKAGYSSYDKMMSDYNAALRNQTPFELIDALELINKSPEQFDWIIAGLLPVGTTALLYADGGTGKTLLVYSMIKAIASGQHWNDIPTKAGKVLLFQTDEPSVVTAQSFKTAQLDELLQPGQLLITHNWDISQMNQLIKSVELHKPILVVIDSLTSSNRNTTSEEKDAEYASSLYELRDLAHKFGCSCLILHHENKNGGIRGSTAIKANVSEVWHLTRNSELNELQRILDVEKSRSGCIGKIQLQLDVDTLGWQHQGEFSSTDKNNKSTSQTKKDQVLAFMQSTPGIARNVDELVAEFGGSKDAMRKTLKRLVMLGLVKTESREKTATQGNKYVYNVYFYPDLSNSSKVLAVPSVELSDKLSDKLPDDDNSKEAVQQIELMDDINAVVIANVTEGSSNEGDDELLDRDSIQEYVQESVQQLQSIADKDFEAIGQNLIGNYFNIKNVDVQELENEQNEYQSATPIKVATEIEQLAALLIKCESVEELNVLSSTYSVQQKNNAFELLPPEQQDKITKLKEQMTKVAA